MTAAQAATLKKVAQAAYELDAFKPNLTRPEADKRIAMLTAKLKLLDGTAAHPLRRRRGKEQNPSRRSLRNPIKCFDQAVARPAAFLRFLRQLADISRVGGDDVGQLTS